MIAQESMEEHIRGSVERLDNQFSTLHQDVATLSCEVLSLYTDILEFYMYYILKRKRIKENAKLFYIYSTVTLILLHFFRHFLTSNTPINKLKIIDSEKFIR